MGCNCPEQGRKNIYLDDAHSGRYLFCLLWKSGVDYNVLTPCLPLITYYFALLAKEHLVRPQFVEKLKNKSVKEGEKLEMYVKAKGNPNPDIVWLKNSDIIVAHKYPNIK